ILLLDRGAQVDAQATMDENGIGGQTPIFHAVTQFNDRGLPVAQLLVERGADLSIRAKLPGAYERPDEVVECTPLGYALVFPGGEGKTLLVLRAQGAVSDHSKAFSSLRVNFMGNGVHHFNHLVPTIIRVRYAQNLSFLKGHANQN